MQQELKAFQSDNEYEKNGNPPHRRGVQWNIGSLIVITSILAIVFGLPLPALALSLPALFCLVFLSFVLLVLVRVTTIKTKRMRAEDFFRVLLANIAIFALVGFCVCGLILWVRISHADNPAETWNQAMKALQPL